MLAVFRNKTNDKDKSKDKKVPISGQPVTPQIATKNKPVTDQTIDYLKGADPDDILELMLPALVQEQQRRLTSTAKELEEIDQRLAKLYTSRDDVYGVMAQAANQNNGATDF